MGSFVVINKDGWIVTAWHIIEQFIQMIDETKASEEYEKKSRHWRRQKTDTQGKK